MAPSGKRPLVFSPLPLAGPLAHRRRVGGLTFAILLIFAAGVGRLIENRLRADFRDELEAAAAEVAFALDASPFSQRTDIERTDHRQRTRRSASSTPNGTADCLQTRSRFPLPARSDQLRRARGGNAQVIPSTATRRTALYVQYARDHDELDATINRLWLFLGVGAAAAPCSPTLAGLWIAQRAMRRSPG